MRLQRDRRLPLAPGVRQCVPVRAGVARAQNVAVRPSRCSCTVDCLLLLTGAREIHANHARSCHGRCEDMQYLEAVEIVLPI